MKQFTDFSIFEASNGANASYKQIGECEFIPISTLNDVKVSCWRAPGVSDDVRSSCGIEAKVKATQKQITMKFNYAETTDALSILHVGESMPLAKYCEMLGRPLADTIIVQHFQLTEAGKAANPDRKSDVHYIYPTCLSDGPEE